MSVYCYDWRAGLATYTSGHDRADVTPLPLEKKTGMHQILTLQGWLLITSISGPLQPLSAQSNETANGDQSRSARKPSRDTEASLKLELSHLQRRYDELLKVKERAAERYKKDYKKWGEFKAWLFAETTNDNDILRALDPEQRKRYKSLVRSKNKKVWKDIGPGLGGEDGLRAAEEHLMDIGVLKRHTFV